MVKKILLAGLFASFSLASLGYTPPKELEVQEADMRDHFVFMNTFLYCNFGKVMSQSERDKVLTPSQQEIVELTEFESFGIHNLGKAMNYMVSDKGLKDLDYQAYFFAKFEASGYAAPDKLNLSGMTYPETLCKDMKEVYSKIEKQVGK